MKLDIQFDGENYTRENITEFINFLSTNKSPNLRIVIEMTYKERLALEFYSHQMQLGVEDLIESSIRSHFDSFFQSL